MGLIKSQDAPTTLAAFSMKDVEQQARALLLAARRKAEQLLVAAQEEGEQIRAQSKAEGFEEGRRAAWEEGLQQGAEAGRQQALAEQSQALGEAVTALVEATRVTRPWPVPNTEMLTIAITMLRPMLITLFR